MTTNFNFSKLIYLFTQLLPGVTYIFNVTASNAEGETLKSFHINNVQGDQKLEHIEGRADLLSVVLVGSQETYANVEFAVEALVTTCYPTQDYYVRPIISRIINLKLMSILCSEIRIIFLRRHFSYYMRFIYFVIR